MLETLIGAVVVAMAALLVVAAVHKLRVVVAGEAGDEPVLRGVPGLQDRPAPALLAAAGVELLLAATLLLLPAAGLTATPVLLAGYSAFLTRLTPEEDCNCFGAAGPPLRRQGAMRRNAAMIGVLLAALTADVLADPGPVVTPDAVAAALVLLAVPAALRVLAAGSPRTVHCDGPAAGSKRLVAAVEAVAASVRAI